VRTVRHALAAVALLLTATGSFADSRMPQAPLAYTQLEDPKQEAEARELMLSIRCLVCQGQSIADSDAELAGDMRSLIRTRIQKGEKPDSIRKWLIERYGDWVTYDPPLSALTSPLWLTPIVLLGLGFLLARGRFRKRR
jgi:cytochrome c-type biogenesis protein CcmH